MQEVFDITVPWISNIPAHPVACLLCGERRIQPLNTFILNGTRFYTVRCLSDGMMWLDPQPTLEFYQRLYAEHYHLAGQDDPLLEQATLDVHTDIEKLRQAARLRLNEIHEFAAPGRLLEVGFGIAHLYHFNRPRLRNSFDGITSMFCALGRLRRAVWRPTRYPGELPSMNVVSRKA